MRIEVRCLKLPSILTIIYLAIITKFEELVIEKLFGKMMSFKYIPQKSTK